MILLDVFDAVPIETGMVIIDATRHFPSSVARFSAERHSGTNLNSRYLLGQNVIIRGPAECRGPC
jgi:hypothetical protein